MTTKLYTIEDIPHSAQLLFTLGLFIIALTPIQQLINNTQQPLVTGAVWFICGLLLISSFHSQRLSQQPIQFYKIRLLVGSAVVLQSIDQIMTLPILSAYSFVFDLYALALLLRIENRKMALSTHWLIVLYLFSIPQWGLSELLQYVLNPSPAEFTWLLSIAILLTSSMAIIRPTRVTSIGFITLFITSCIISKGLNNNLSVTIISTIILLVVVFVGRTAYQHPKKPHPFTDTTTWVIPKAVKSDGWWLEQEKKQLKQVQYKVFSVLFITYSICILWYSQVLHNNLA